jgi:hypothetical protein
MRNANAVADGWPSRRLPNRFFSECPPVIRLCLFCTAWSVLIVGGLFWLANPAALFAQDAPSLTVVINELHVDPLGRGDPLEFVELYNPTSQPVDLTGWTLTGAVDFQFPPGASLPAGGWLVVAQDPAFLQSRFGALALGPFRGQLANSGETITLLDHRAQVVDEVAYGLGFPWPTSGEGSERSLQLINPSFDNARPANWRSAPPTPGYANLILVDNPPPAIDAVGHAPLAPTSADAIRVTATVTDSDGVASVWLYYQVVAPGAYIRIWDAAYATDWTPLAMNPIGGDRYQVEMPPDARRHRHLVRYRIVATDNGGRTLTVPYEDDPQPNFAYFVYDGVPPWEAAIRPGAADWQGVYQHYDFNAARPLPVYHFLARHEDVADAQFIPDSPLEDGYMGDDYLWYGTLIYNGQVYDHITFRARGGMYRYAVGKNMWKFNFTRGHGFQAYDDYGRPYPTLWDKLNFSALIQHANRGYRGEQGLFESVSFRLFNLAGVPASRTHFVHFRVVDQEAEAGADQYSGDFWGLYLAIEEVDGAFLDAHQLPDGNLYKMENGTGELNNHGLNAPTDKSDLNAFLAAFRDGNPTSEWWRSNLNLSNYYSYRSLIEALHSYDINQEKNYLYFNDPTTARWSVFPWDLDLTWAESMPGNGNEPFRDRVLPIPEFQVGYHNRLRELRDLLFNPEQVFALIDEQAALINTPADGLSLVDADRAKWDYNPLLINRRYIIIERAGHGRYYRSAASEDFPGMVQLMKDWVVTRSQWLDQTFLNDPWTPRTPALVYVGPPGFPADQLTFQSSPYIEPHAPFAAMQWRVAEVSWPGLPGHATGAPNRYEIEATWQSDELSDFVERMTIPAGACMPGRVCRVRVRMKDAFDRWSHWSPPVEFVAGDPGLPPPTTLVVSELMYHPPAQDNVPETEFEFVELYNSGDSTLDLTNLRFTAGISYTFPIGARLAPGQYVVLAENVAWFESRYGLPATGQYALKLSNGGDHVTLRDAFDRTIFDLTYDDDLPWPPTAGGLGHSLVLNNPTRAPDPNQPANWRASYFPGGSPGAPDPLPLVINEVLASPGPGQQVMIELYNPTGFDLDLRGWSLLDSNGKAHKLPNRIVGPGEFWVTTAAEFGQAAESLVLNVEGGLAVEAPAVGLMRRYRHAINYRFAPTGLSSGRYINGAGQERFPLLSAVTPARDNAPPLVGPVVMSEVAYRAENGLEFIELTNTSNLTVALYDPAQPERTWRIDGALFQFPTGVTIAPAGKLVVTSLDPTAICTNFQVADQVRVLGPLPIALDDQAQRLALERPLTGVNGAPLYVVVDEVGYSNLTPWPRAGEPGATLERLRLDGYGDDPLSWRRGVRTNDLIRPAAPSALLVDLCSFEAGVNDEGGMTIRWVTHSEQNVTGYHLWRSLDPQREHAIRVTDAPVSGQGAGASYEWLDSTRADLRYTYWLVAIGPNAEQIEVAFTTVRTPARPLHLPLVFD